MTITYPLRGLEDRRELFINAREHGTKSGRAIGRPTANVDIALVMECADRGYTYTHAARVLGINRTTLRTHLVRTGLWEDYNTIRQKALMTENTDCLYTEVGEHGE
jgi:DNA invertase Pin-like site-specific DNA recombinase